MLGTALLGIFLGRLQVYPEGATPQAGVALLLADFTYRRQVATVAIDTVLVVVAYYSAYLLRFEEQFAAEQGVFQQSLPIVLLFGAMFYWLWRVRSRRTLPVLVTES